MSLKSTERIPIVAIVGKSGSGKTTLIEKLIPALQRRGYRIGTVKHHRHDFAIDQAGKDSWRHARAGAETVVIASPYKLACVKKMNADLSPEEMRARFFDDVDLIIVEGYKTQVLPRIEVFRTVVHDQPLFTAADHLIALVSDRELHLGVPCFGLEDIVPLVDLLEQTFALKIKD